MSNAGYCYYKSARDEIIMRLRLRNQILLSFIVSSGALIGIALSGIGSSAETIALAVPFLAFGTSILVAVHSCAITNLGMYVDELIPAINECESNNNEVLPWDSSNTFKSVCEQSSKQRFCANFFVLLVPSAFALLVGWDKFSWPFQFPTDIHSTLWLLGVIQIFLIFLALNKIHTYRISSLIKKKLE